MDQRVNVPSAVSERSKERRREGKLGSLMKKSESKSVTFSRRHFIVRVFYLLQTGCLGVSANA
jgi:hypothetical protein